MIRLRERTDTWFKFFIRIIFPTFLAVVFSIGTIYLVIIPAFKSSFFDGKKEMIRQLTHVAWSILELYQIEEESGRMSRQEAQEMALIALKSLRYGEENRDYFWVTDNSSVMLMHPYSSELIGVDLTDFEDAEGKKLFQEIKKTVSKQESGFVGYSWNKKYAEEVSVPKLSYVKRFSPWQWVVGTGVFLDDVERKITTITKHLSRLSLAAVSLLTLLLLYVGRQSFTIELQRKRAETDLKHSRKKYKRLVDTATDPILMFFEHRCIYSNKPVQALLQYSMEELEGVDVNDIFFYESCADNEEETNSIAESLEEHVGQHEVTLRSKKNDPISVQLLITKIDLGGREAVVMNIKDLSEEKKVEKELDESERERKEQERENLIVELQTSLLFLSQPVAHVLGEYITCDHKLSIAHAAALMRDSHSSSLLVRNESGIVDGIVTDMALREKVVADSLPYDTSVAAVMSSPLIFIESSALIFEASLLMEEQGVKHLVVKGSSGDIESVISNEDLLNVHRYSSTFLINQINEAQSVDEIIDCHDRLPRIIKALVDSGAHAKNITRIITTVSDAILGRFIDFAIKELGQPPARFAFISLGSEGREEQTLATDQDNAIIFEDVTEEEKDTVFSYFLTFSERVCTWLDKAGYDFCKGDVMAMNPRWCQPIGKWKEYFSCWITEAKPQDLMEVSIFFDFRCMYGDVGFIQELREDITKRVANRDAFFYQLAQNALLFRIPVDFFGNIAVESRGEHPDTFNIKHVIALIVGYARLYAINFSLDETNTLQRLDLLKQNDFIGESTHEEIYEAYNYLMQIRFKHQVTMMNRGLVPDNHIRLEELNHMEKSVLKKIFAQVGSLQKRLSSIGKVEIFF